jgi:hypothetical protein
MEWSKQLLPILQAGLKVYASGSFLKKSTDNAKAIALQSSAIAFGSFAFLLFFVASIIISFVDLGNQLEAQSGLHFSGLMQSSLYMLLLGAGVLGISLGVAKYLAAKEAEKKKELEAVRNPYEPLILFGEELLKQLIANLNRPDGQTPPSQTAPESPTKP